MLGSEAVASARRSQRVFPGQHSHEGPAFVPFNPAFSVANLMPAPNSEPVAGRKPREIEV